jgi:hypothetical protein
MLNSNHLKMYHSTNKFNLKVLRPFRIHIVISLTAMKLRYGPSILLKYHPLTHFRWIPPCFISETTNFSYLVFCYLCIFFPGSNIHVITISALNMRIGQTSRLIAL